MILSIAIAFLATMLAIPFVAMITGAIADISVYMWRKLQ